MIYSKLNNDILALRLGLKGNVFDIYSSLMPTKIILMNQKSQANFFKFMSKQCPMRKILRLQLEMKT